MAIGIFGDTTELPYNFSTKVVGNMTECPMKCYYTANLTLLLPNDNKWIEFDQVKYDKIKYQDNNAQDITTTTVGEKAQILMELDLNGLCNNLYGGSNITMKNNIKSLFIKAYGENTNGWEMYVWDTETNKWTLWSEGVSNIENNSLNQYPYSLTNKVYILLASKNPASSTIPSNLSLDFIEIKINMLKQSDLVNPININLNENWSILIKGFYPSWDSSIKEVKTILELKNDEKWIKLYYNGISKQFVLNYSDGTDYIEINEPIINQYQNFNFLIGVKDKKIFFYLLINDKIKKGIAVKNIDILFGSSAQIYILQNRFNQQYADAFIEDIQFLNQNFTEQELEIILKGKNTIDINNPHYNELAEIYKNPNIIPLFNDVRWIKPSNTVVSPDGATLTLNGTSNFQNSFIQLSVFPNNKYQLKSITDKNKVGSGVRCYIAQYCNNTVIKAVDAIIKTDIQENTFTTLPNCNSIKVFCTNDNDGVGVFTFSNLELRRLDN